MGGHQSSSDTSSDDELDTEIDEFDPGGADKEAYPDFAFGDNNLKGGDEAECAVDDENSEDKDGDEDDNLGAVGGGDQNPEGDDEGGHVSPTKRSHSTESAANTEAVSKRTKV